MVSVATYIVLWAMSITGTGIFLAIGFELGRWIVNKVKGWFSFRKGLHSDTVDEFIQMTMATQAMKEGARS